MNVQQLKLLAERVRDLLEQYSPVSHGQALDLIAALPGLRNWPEVVAFPTRVAGCELTESTAARLSRRLKNRLAVEIEVPALIRALEPSAAAAHAGLPELWPTGPEAGIYITTSQDAIDALMRSYDMETDGAPIYAERAGDTFDSSIDLGEQGLWSQGLGRVPSGTLIVIGPIEMTQEEWERNAERLQQACLHVQLSGHRVAALFHTPAPGQLRSDALLLVKSGDPLMDDLHEAFKGVVSEDGEMLPVVPFMAAPPKPAFVPSPPPLIELPLAVTDKLNAALAIRRAGIIVFGSNERKTDRVALLEALLPTTDVCGPAARIRPDHRHDYDGEPPLSARFEGLPVMPSVESAYAHGYRRMIIEKGHGASEYLLKYAEEVCFLVGVFSAEAGSAFMNATSPRHVDDPRALEHLLAVVGIAAFDTKKGTELVADMFVNVAGAKPASTEIEDIIDHVNAHRTLRWEDGLERLLAQKLVAPADVKKACPNHHAIQDYVAKRGKRIAAMSA